MLILGAEVAWLTLHAMVSSSAAGLTRAVATGRVLRAGTGAARTVVLMAEDANMITVAALATTVFLGGWRGPFLPPVVWFLAKLYLVIFLFIWVRATLPRFRYDQLMRFGWKVLLPLALANIVITAAFVALR